MQATRSQSIWRRLEELQVEDEGEIQHLGINKYIPLVSCISNLFTSWHCLVRSQSIFHRYLLGTYRCGIRILSAMVCMESGWCRLHCSPFCRARLLELWYRVLRSSSVPVTHEGYLVESRRPLWFGSSQANRSIFNTLSWHSPLAAVSRSTSIISLRFGSSASPSSPFSSSCYVGSPVQPFCHVSLVS